MVIIKYFLIFYNVMIILGAIQETIKNKTGMQNFLIYVMSVLTIIYLIGV